MPPSPTSYATECLILGFDLLCVTLEFIPGSLVLVGFCSGLDLSPVFEEGSGLTGGLMALHLCFSLGLALLVV